MRQLKELNLLYFTPEFAKIAGDNKVMAAMPQYAVRVHSIQAAEVDRLSPPNTWSDFESRQRAQHPSLAAWPLSTTSETGLKNLSSTLSKVSHELSKDGVPLGPPKTISGAQRSHLRIHGDRDGDGDCGHCGGVRSGAPGSHHGWPFVRVDGGLFACALRIHATIFRAQQRARVSDCRLRVDLHKARP